MRQFVVGGSVAVVRLRLRRWLRLGVAVSLVCVCGAAMANPEPDVTVIIAVEPACRLFIFEGESDAAGVWRRSATKAAAWARSEDGFIVLRLNPRTGRQSYGVTTIFFDDGTPGIYEASSGGSVAVFNAPPGAATFVGRLMLGSGQTGLVVSVDNAVTRQAVAEFVAKKHPELPASLEVGSLQMLTTHEPAAPPGVLTSYTFGMAGGPAALKLGAEQRARAGSGGSVSLTFGVALWDHVPINFSLGRLILEDREPFTEFVVDCTTQNGVSLGCSDPHAQESKVTSGLMLGLETGYQYRFRPASWTSLVPAVIVGHIWTASGFSRGVGCDGCKSIPLSGVDVEGSYVGPSLKMTFGASLAVTARAEWFLNGDLSYRALFGGELGAP